MKITVLVPDFSINYLVQAYPVAEVLKRRYEVQVIGPQFGEQAYAPYAADLQFESVRSGKLKAGWSRVADELESKIEGDVLYVCEPMQASLGIALRHQRRTGKPIVLHIVDLEYIFPLIHSVPATIRQLLLGWLRVDGIYDRLWAHRQARKADAVFVVSTNLRRKYGGEILYHGCDTEVFHPSRYNRAEIREELGVAAEEKLAVFAGSALPHKGIGHIVRALAELDLPHLKMLFVGASPIPAYYEELLRIGGDRIIAVGQQPHHLMPRFLACGDYVVLPQRDTIVARHQVPQKIFEAMAMGKTVIGTAVGDIPLLLDDGCGIVIAPEDESALQRALRRVYEGEEEAEQMGKKARQRAVERFSYEAMDRTMHAVLREFE